ncbi:hypothetical protein [Paracoccus methylarcula]|uniref:CopG family transcriptional regulator n=1 Tax=Paracoccus methylarcula TaxID=72022 RepID=A0A422R0T9_9RHOB|nr:hypothetical protein [Paracoccus methylarcula]RNF35865.1 hypothetical protein A7A09_000050 [Paracoccus methylarcula]
MTRHSLASALNIASERTGDVVDHEIAALLRRAAIRIRNSNTVMIDADVDFALAEVAFEKKIEKDELIRHILRNWVQENYLSEITEIEDSNEARKGARLSLRH